MKNKHSVPKAFGRSERNQARKDPARRLSSIDYSRYLKIIAVALALLSLLTYILFDVRFRVVEEGKEVRLSEHLSSHEASIFLPYTKTFSTERVPCVRTTIDGTDLNLPVDTGSTGLFIGAPKLPNVDTRNAPRGYQFLTSSTLLYSGHVVELEITFHGAHGNSAISQVPVLIVDRSVKCPWYNMTKNAGRCPPNPRNPSKKPIERDVSRIMYMGVGFGRNRQDDDRAIAVPKGNPFLNLVSINKQILPPGAFRAGYTVSTEGIHLGLTEHNTQSFIFTDLDRGATHKKDPRDWAMLGMSLRLNNGSTFNGSALIDTGIPQMYLRTDVGTKIPNITIPNPNGKGVVKRVPAGTKIAVGFPKFNGVAGYSFVVGEGSPVEPKYVVPTKQLAPPYVNTGRNLLFLYSVAFDAVGGRFGFRPVPPGGSSSKI